MGPYEWGFLDGVGTIIGFLITVKFIGCIGDIIVAKIRGGNHGAGGNQQGGGGNHGAGGNQHGGGGNHGAGANQAV